MVIQFSSIYVPFCNLGMISFYFRIRIYINRDVMYVRNLAAFLFASR